MPETCSRYFGHLARRDDSLKLALIEGVEADGEVNGLQPLDGPDQTAASSLQRCQITEKRGKEMK